MKLIKTESGYKLLISKKEYEEVGRRFVESARLSSIRVQEMESFLKRLGYIRNISSGSSHTTCYNPKLDGADERQYLPLTGEGRDFVDKGQMVEILTRLGIDINDVLGRLPKDYVLELKYIPKGTRWHKFHNTEISTKIDQKTAPKPVTEIKPKKPVERKWGDWRDFHKDYKGKAPVDSSNA